MSYNADATSVNKPLLMAGHSIEVWTADPTIKGSPIAPESQQICLHRDDHFPTVFSVELQFSGAPGAFSVDVQVADTDADAFYITKSSITAVNSSQAARAEFSVVGKFVRLRMGSLTNTVNVTARFT